MYWNYSLLWFLAYSDLPWFSFSVKSWQEYLIGLIYFFLRKDSLLWYLWFNLFISFCFHRLYEYFLNFFLILLVSKISNVGCCYSKKILWINLLQMFNNTSFMGPLFSPAQRTHRYKAQSWLTQWNLNNKLVWYLNGPKLSNCWMVCYSGRGLNNKITIKRFNRRARQTSERIWKIN